MQLVMLPNTKCIEKCNYTKLHCRMCVKLIKYFIINAV